jgi:hypothetical protein
MMSRQERPRQPRGARRRGGPCSPLFSTRLSLASFIDPVN